MPKINNSTKHDFNTGPKDDPRPCIPEGEYEAYCFKVEKSKYLGNQEKLYVWYRITEGKYEGTELFCAYNINYKAIPRGAKYYTDWSIANDGLPKRSDKMSSEVFLKKVFLVKVRYAVPKYDDATPKHEMFQYSVVDRIIEKLAG